jgi:putative NIF3 family GTP cyclohydrolase 1 type 2
LDINEHVVDEAIEQEAGLIVSHHPLIFHPVKNLLLNQPFGKIVSKLIKHNISAISAHTNLDSAQGGINDQLAELLDLQNVEILAPEKEAKLFKLVIFVPEGFQEQVRNAICGAGAGWIGNYSY